MSKSKWHNNFKLLYLRNCWTDLAEILHAGRVQVKTTACKIPAQSVKGRQRYGVVTHSCNAVNSCRLGHFLQGHPGCRKFSARISALQEIFCVAENVAERFLRRRKFLHCRKFLQGRYREPETFSNNRSF